MPVEFFAMIRGTGHADRIGHVAFSIGFDSGRRFGVLDALALEDGQRRLEFA
jgi:hypothetical protein